jgi:hypothetical protein
MLGRRDNRTNKLVMYDPHNRLTARAFRQFSSLRGVEFAEGSDLKNHCGIHKCRLFIAYETDHLKGTRPRFHVGRDSNKPSEASA